MIPIELLEQVGLSSSARHCRSARRILLPALSRQKSRWLADPAVFAKHDIDPLSVPATAAVQIKENLEALDKRLERAERRCDTIIQQLEYRREVFAHRARQAAGNILKAVTVQAHA